jgi:5-deoxy-glucuronate isomerase
MSRYVSSPTPREANGRIQSVTTASAGWKYIGFEVYKLNPGETLTKATGDQEACLVLVTGRADISTRRQQWVNIGQRMSVFEKTPPYSVYVPNGDEYSVKALTPLELAVCLAPGKGNHPARLIEPKQVGRETRGFESITRHVVNILPDTEPADSLLVVEVFTPNGNWSSYPPHKHDRDALPEESSLEETYYFHVDPPQGFAMQRVYTDDRSIDEALVVHDGEVVMVPRGYHPVSAPPGYEVYYLNVMAGPKRKWKFTDDPAHTWIKEAKTLVRS